MRVIPEWKNDFYPGPGCNADAPYLEFEKVARGNSMPESLSRENDLCDHTLGLS